MTNPNWPFEADEDETTQEQQRRLHALSKAIALAEEDLGECREHTKAGKRMPPSMREKYDQSMEVLRKARSST